MGAILSILVLLTIALLVGAVFLWRRGGHAKQVALMVLLAAVTAVNVAIWTLPDASGEPPAARLPN